MVQFTKVKLHTVCEVCLWNCVTETSSCIFIVFGILSNFKSDEQHWRGRQKPAEKKSSAFMVSSKNTLLFVELML